MSKRGLEPGRVDYACLVGQLRSMLGMTQEQFAQELGVTFATINGWERGRHRPMPVLARMLIAMAEEHGCRLHEVSSTRSGGRARLTGQGEYR